MKGNDMHLDLTDQDLDYMHRVLLTRPMGEVEALVAKIRQQVTQQQQASRFEKDILPPTRPGNGADEGTGWLHTAEAPQ
jgi:hypothetical protein